jgi:hypothetical protein
MKTLTNPERISGTVVLCEVIVEGGFTDTVGGGGVGRDGR